MQKGLHKKPPKPGLMPVFHLVYESFRRETSLTPPNDLLLEVGIRVRYTGFLGIAYTPKVNPQQEEADRLN